MQFVYTLLDSLGRVRNPKLDTRVDKELLRRILSASVHYRSFQALDLQRPKARLLSLFSS